MWHRTESENAHTYAMIFAVKDEHGITIEKAIIVKPKEYSDKDKISGALARNGFDLAEIGIELENKFENDED